MKTKFIVYTEVSGHEILVTTPESEPQLLEEYFDNGGRELDDFDRTVVLDCGVEIHTRMNAVTL